MAAEDAPDKTGISILEIPKQDFFQEAKTLIAQHHKKINENKVPGTSINVFRNKHQKPKSTKFIPLEIKKKETLDAVQELQAAYKKICFPKDRSKSRPSEEPPQRTAFHEPHIFNIKKKHKEPIDLIVKEQVKLDKIVTNIESVSKKMEKEKQLHHGKTRKLDSFSAFPVFNLDLHLRPMTSSSMGQLKEHDRTLYDWRGSVSKKFSRLTHDSSWPSFSGSSLAFQDYSSKNFIKKEQQSVKPESKPQPSYRKEKHDGILLPIATSFGGTLYSWQIELVSISKQNCEPGL